MKLKLFYIKFSELSEYLQSFGLLVARLLIAYGFYNPAMMKWKDIDSVASWFGSMGIPMPTLNAYLATGTEMAAVFLLPLGLGTRIISIPLIITMVVAIVTVHLNNGFSAGDNGFEIPLYYMLMLFTLLINGSGKFSIDYLISKWRNS